MRTVVAIVMAAAVGLAAAAPATAAPADPRLAAVSSWGFAIGTGTLRGDLATRYADYDLLVVDGQEARRGQIRTLREGGTVVLGYLSVGTIEAYRPWYRSLKRYRLERWKDWQDEFYADVSKRGFRRTIQRRIAPRLLDKGFDGLFLDNVDMIETHPRQARGMRRLVRGLSRRTHAGGGLLFAQNGHSILAPLLPWLDGWNREDVTATYDFGRDRYRANPKRRIAAAQRELRAVADAGLLVTATDYTRRRRGRLTTRAVVNACAAGALPFVSDIALRRVPRRAMACG